MRRPLLKKQPTLTVFEPFVRRIPYPLCHSTKQQPSYYVSIWKGPYGRDTGRTQWGQFCCAKRRIAPMACTACDDLVHCVSLCFAEGRGRMLLLPGVYSSNYWRWRRSWAGAICINIGWV